MTPEATTLVQEETFDELARMLAKGELDESEFLREVKELEYEQRSSNQN